MEGYVFKWINFIKGWKPRYLQLDKNNLYMSKKKDDQNEQIELKTAKIISEKKKKQFCIEIKPNKLIYLKTNTENEKTLWVSALTEAIEIQSKYTEIILEDNNVDQSLVSQVSMNGLTFNFSEQYKTFQNEINKNENETDLYGNCIKNILTMQNLLFEYTHSMEALNLHIFEKNKKKTHPLKNIYDDLNNIKYELKVTIELS
jgi:hypothetical protein